MVRNPPSAQTNHGLAVETVHSCVESLDRQGFVVVRELFSEWEIREIEPALDSLLLEPNRVSWRRRDLSATTQPDAPCQPEFAKPSSAHRGLKRSRIYARCQALAAELIGGKAYYLFDHAIYKMPNSNTQIPWHQDLAYLGEFALQIRSFHFWIPLQDTAADAGALRFLAGSHKSRLLEHVSRYAENPHVLTIKDAAEAMAIAVPVKLGDVCIHTPLTVHGSGPNTSARTRKAWIIHFGDRPIWYKHFLKCRNLIARAVTHAGAP